MPSFETKICGRCRGSGQYSYCQMHGTTCFGCGGKGRVYTNRAKLAMERVRKLRETDIGDVVVGMRVFVPGVGRFTVRTAGESGARYLENASGEWRNYREIGGEKLGYCGIPGQTTVQVIPPAEIARQQVAEAIEYQNSLRG